MKRTAWVVALALLAIPAGAGERLKIHVSQSGMAPAELSILTVVEPSNENARLVVVADSSEFFRSSTIDLDGEHAPRVTSIRFPQIPSGIYDLTVTVYARDGSPLASAMRRFTIP